MNTFFNTPLSRRGAIKLGALGGISLGFGTSEEARAAQKWYESKEGKAKSVIQVVCPGAMAAQESFNPKPEAPIEYRGPYGVVKTKVPGYVFSENMPAMAKIADKLCVLRGMNGKESDHGRGSYAMATGYRQSPAIKHPSMGVVVNHEFGARAGLPASIGIPTIWDGGAGTGYLNPKYSPFDVGGDPASDKGFKVFDLNLPKSVTEAALNKRKGLREMLNNQFRKMEADPKKLEMMDSFYKEAYDMISSEKVRDAFDLSKEPQKLKEAYGLGQFYRNGGSQAGMRCLLARRLVEAGARFVTVRFGEWDHHVQIREEISRNLPPLDQAVAMLIKDLDERGLLDSTIVWIVSEFGRTPKINAQAGRDHYSRVFSACLAGGGLKRGLFFGDSDLTSSEVIENGVTVEDLHSTIYHLLGINSDKELLAPGPRPMEIIDGGKVRKEILA
ncbi:MAG: DUF1501 domain-containing protein [Lentisphaeraceae bacterium]|nr:DUF1501 domain-containing protein [Lentisphaeraceae bacterium]